MSKEITISPRTIFINSPSGGVAVDKIVFNGREYSIDLIKAVEFKISVDTLAEMTLTYISPNNKEEDVKVVISGQA